MRISNLTTLVLCFVIGFGCAGSKKSGADVQAAPVMLTGQVRIGPTQPVATSDAEQKAASYKDRNLLIYDGENKLVRTLALAEDGSFAISLPPGDYRLNMKLKGIERASDMPRKVSLQPGKTAQVVIDIDTGIR